MTILENPFIPDDIKRGITHKQALFLVFEGREAFYGGAAGGGKSVAILLAALMYVCQPGYHALIMRRTHKQLAKADSILSKAKEWLMNAPGVRWNGEDNKFTFPSGATLEFGHMEHENAKFNYQGGTWHFIGVDEATQFTEEMISYPRSRQRRDRKFPVPVRWRGSGNPGGIGHEHIKHRYVKDEKGHKVAPTADRQFFPAKLSDNPHLDPEEYTKTLKESGVDPLTLAQLLEGDWDAVPGGRFKRDWFHDWTRRGDYIVLHRPGLRPADYPEFMLSRTMRFMTCDPAASTSQKADYTVISVWCVSPWGDLVWLDCLRVKREIPDIVPEIQKVWAKWSPAFVGIEAIASNVAVYQWACRATSPVLIARPLNKGDKDKLIHATPAIVLASTHRVFLPADGVDQRFPKSDILSELVRFTGDDKLDDHDDIVDTLSYATECMQGMPTLANRNSGPKVLGGAR